MISFNLAQIKSFIKFCVNIFSICFSMLEGSRDFIASICVSVCFSKAFPKGKYANLAYSIIFLWLKGTISSPARNSDLLIFPVDQADIFAASLLIWYCSF